MPAVARDPLRAESSGPATAALAAALAGVTPTLLAVVTALVVARSTGFAMSVWAARPIGGLPIVAAFASSALSQLLSAGLALFAIAATSNLGPDRGWRRHLALALAVVLSTAAGAAAGPAVIDRTSLALAALPAWTGPAPPPVIFQEYVRIVWPRNMIFAGLLTLAFEILRHLQVAASAARQASFDRVALERELDESRAQVLRAQIEPHFLFNTLAHVQQLLGADPAAGRSMLDSLTRYLEVALPRMREPVTTLRQDVDLIEAYLRIQQIRMGRRLAYSIDLPEELGGRLVPPMLLLTLVENAVKHGLQPVLRGGEIRVSAAVEGDRLRLRVADSGAGLAPGSGTGTGLAHVRARLAAQYGNTASLALAQNDLGGVTATITLPHPDRGR
jgi:signal transduction histidine kinase